MDNVIYLIRKAVSAAAIEDVLDADEIALIEKHLNAVQYLSTVRAHLHLAVTMIEDLEE